MRHECYGEQGVWIGSEDPTIVYTHETFPGGYIWHHGMPLQDPDGKVSQEARPASQSHHSDRRYLTDEEVERVMQGLQRKGWTKTGLSKMLGSGNCIVSEWISGKRPIGPERREKMWRLLA